jgi:hypothetical protein
MDRSVGTALVGWRGVNPDELWTGAGEFFFEEMAKW